VFVCSSAIPFAFLVWTLLQHTEPSHYVPHTRGALAPLQRIRAHGKTETRARPEQDQSKTSRRAAGRSPCLSCLMHPGGRRCGLPSRCGGAPSQRQRPALLISAPVAAGTRSSSRLCASRGGSSLPHQSTSSPTFTNMILCGRGASARPRHPPTLRLTRMYLVERREEMGPRPPRPFGSHR
jgi:hypothetical protein